MKDFDTVLNSGLFGELKKQDLRAAYESLNISRKEYEKGNSIFLEGEIINKLCIVEQGSVTAEKIYLSGNVQIADIYEQRDMFAVDCLLSRKKTSDVNYTAASNCSIVFITMDSIQKSVFRKELMVVLVYELANSNIKKSRKIDILAEKSLRNKILMYLKLISKRQGSNEFNINMTQEQFAQFLCVNRSALTNELNQMKKDGLLDYTKDHFVLKEIS